MRDSLIYLSETDVEELLPTASEMVAAMESIFLSRANGNTIGKSKVGIYTGESNFFFGLMAGSVDLGYAICHNSMGGPPSTSCQGRHHIQTIEILSDIKSAEPVAILDAHWLTTWLPACVTTVAARYLANPHSKTIGFIASGATARATLSALCALFPIERVIAYDSSQESLEIFLQHAATTGLSADSSDSPHEVVANSDIVVTSVPHYPSLKPFLKPDWVNPGTFVSMIDLARSWEQGIEKFDHIATDDHDQVRSAFSDGRLKFSGPYDSDLTELVSGLKSGRGNQRQRSAIVHPGHAIGVLALAVLVYERAYRSKKGLKIQR
jgi:ornithine cyclodeaminase/alanine dehydrogenase-like protein (mu-crystallin family)